MQCGHVGSACQACSQDCIEGFVTLSTRKKFTRLPLATHLRSKSKHVPVSARLLGSSHFADLISSVLPKVLQET